jgi:hypothetical protein
VREETPRLRSEQAPQSQGTRRWKGQHPVCHCEERSDEAISVVKGINDEIAAASLDGLAMTW